MTIVAFIGRESPQAANENPRLGSCAAAGAASALAPEAVRTTNAGTRSRRVSIFISLLLVCHGLKSGSLVVRVESLLVRRAKDSLGLRLARKQARQRDAHRGVDGVAL